MNQASLLTIAAVAYAPTTLTAQDVLADWSATALYAIRTESTAPPVASRNLAILYTAVFDAVNGVRPRYEHWLVAPAAPFGSSDEAALSAAAHDALVALYPNLRQTFDALHARVLDRLPNGQAKVRGLEWGARVARDILASRSNDGARVTEPYPGSTVPGMWRPTISFGGVVRPALLPAWGRVTPFALPAGSFFRPAAPPALPTLQYAFEVLEVQYIGGRVSPYRTADQTEIAHFWAYGPGTVTPPGHWNQILHAVDAARHDRLVDRARRYALLNVALADSAIASWDCKYVYGYWRPITAINLADQDSNPITQPDPDWRPLIETPPFPEYTSGHSTFSGAGAAVLGAVYGTDRVPFTVGSDDLPGVQRHYEGFIQAAWESGRSRIYGGIHFTSANLNGLICGWQIGQHVVAQKLRPLHR